MKKIFLILFISIVSLSYSQKINLVVGGTYTLYSWVSKNPFEKQTKAIVRIVAIKKGWVKYCWHYDYEKQDSKRVCFYRSEEDFIELINNEQKQL